MEPPKFVVGFESGSSLLRESNHRIANNLMTIATLLRHQSRQLAKIGQSFTADQMREILNDAGQRIEMVGRLHRRLGEPIAPDILNLSPYLNDVAETAIDSLSAPGEVEFQPISGDMCPVDANQALLIGLLMGELVTGAVKFARRTAAKSKLRLTCGAVDGGLEIALANEGVRVTEAYDPDRNDSFGLSVAKLLVAQLKATLTFQAGDMGLVARLRVPTKTGIDLAALGAAGQA